MWPPVLYRCLLLLTTAGNSGIRVMASGATGGQGIAEKAVFVDPVPLTGSWTVAANQPL
jgi:hypothetical protein